MKVFLQFRIMIRDKLDDYIPDTEFLKLGERTQRIPILAVRYRVRIRDFRGIKDLNKVKLKVIFFDENGKEVHSDIWEENKLTSLGITNFIPLPNDVASAKVEKAC